MNITLEITPQLQAELARQAAAAGRGPETYAASLLEAALDRPVGANSSQAASAPFGAGLVDAFAKAHELFAEGELDFSRDLSPGRPVELS